MKKGLLKSVFLAALLPFLCLFCSQGYKPHAFGPRDMVEVVTDTLTWRICSGTVKNILWDMRYYPSFEHVFDMEYISPEKFWEKRTDYWRRHNLIFIITPQNREEIRRIIGGKIMLEEGIQSAEDVWASPQLVVVIEKDTNGLVELIENNSENIFSLFFEAASERIEYMIYAGGYQENLSLALRAGYGFDIKMPYYYVVADSQGSPQKGHVITVQHMRSGTDNALSRYVILFWFNDSNQTILTEETFPLLRDNFAAAFLGGDSCDVKNFGSDEMGYWFEGIWQNSEKGIGGPFKSWVVSENGRTFILDVHLFAPGNKKSFYLEELRLIVKTFKMIS
ncbi:DUF4837 family protein [candidate division WOR-3 bacterium]|nr:DUF4837 family protein [candidate division WOR-3 bacterium]